MIVINILKYWDCGLRLCRKIASLHYLPASLIDFHPCIITRDDEISETTFFVLPASSMLIVVTSLTCIYASKSKGRLQSKSWKIWRLYDKVLVELSGCHNRIEAVITTSQPNQNTLKRVIKAVSAVYASGPTVIVVDMSWWFLQPEELKKNLLAGTAASSRKTGLSAKLTGKASLLHL